MRELNTKASVDTQKNTKFLALSLTFSLVELSITIIGIIYYHKMSNEEYSGTLMLIYYVPRWIIQYIMILVILCVFYFTSRNSLLTIRLFFGFILYVLYTTIFYSFFGSFFHPNYVYAVILNQMFGLGSYVLFLSFWKSATPIFEFNPKGVLLIKLRYFLSMGTLLPGIIVFYPDMPNAINWIFGILTSVGLIMEIVGLSIVIHSYRKSGSSPQSPHSDASHITHDKTHRQPNIITLIFGGLFVGFSGVAFSVLFAYMVLGWIINPYFGGGGMSPGKIEYLYGSIPYALTILGVLLNLVIKNNREKWKTTGIFLLCMSVPYILIMIVLIIVLGGLL